MLYWSKSASVPCSGYYSLDLEESALVSSTSCDIWGLPVSQSPAYTLVWTRQGRGNLPDRAVDFNGILTIHNVQPEDAGIYVCTGSNMLAMDEGTAILHVPGL